MDRILQYCRLLKAKKMLHCYEYNNAKYKIQTADIELSLMEVSKNIYGFHLCMIFIIKNSTNALKATFENFLLNIFVNRKKYLH